MSILNIVAACFLFVAVAIAAFSHLYIQQRVITTGSVTNLAVSRGSKGGRIYYIVAAFHDATGTLHNYKSSVGTSNPGYKVGDSIRICYRTNDPESCGVYSFGYRFGLAWAFACVGLALLLMSLGFNHGQIVMDRIYVKATPELR
jgi:hypothetical protein